MTSGRWHPSQEQISLAIDCAVARMPIGKAAGLLGVGPRTLWLFAKRAGLPDIFGAWREVAPGRPKRRCRYIPPRPRKAVPDGPAPSPACPWSRGLP
jgi:hypothetical protein